MTKLNVGQAKKLLITLRDFILHEVLQKDSVGQYEIKEIFQQLIDLLDQRTLHP